ncbi:MAG: nucleotidyltransferase domain-containing protein [Betaproteobacteria bacterium]|nr:nucleotidyltransferase domain-containing protein [Betaproteobacteria bacterium]
MRLKRGERAAITQAAHDVFAPGTAVFLFGSRVDDSKRGGDIDLLVETPQPMSAAELVDHRTRFVARLYRLLEEQRIDIVITARQERDTRPVVSAARRTGILLAQV